MITFISKNMRTLLPFSLCAGNMAFAMEEGWTEIDSKEAGELTQKLAETNQQPTNEHPQLTEKKQSAPELTLKEQPKEKIRLDKYNECIAAGKHESVASYIARVAANPGKEDGVVIGTTIYTREGAKAHQSGKITYLFPGSAVAGTWEEVNKASDLY